MIWAGRSGRDGRFFYFHLLANWKNDYLCMRNTDGLRFRMIKKAQVAELVDALVSGASGFAIAGSSPVLGTSQNRKNAILYRRRKGSQYSRDPTDNVEQFRQGRKLVWREVVLAYTKDGTGS